MSSTNDEHISNSKIDDGEEKLRVVIRWNISFNKWNRSRKKHGKTKRLNKNLFKNSKSSISSPSFLLIEWKILLIFIQQQPFGDDQVLFKQ